MLKNVKAAPITIFLLIFEQLKITDMKRKSLQEVMKMTEKQRFMYYAELFWGDPQFDLKMTPGGRSAYAMRWQNGECTEGPEFLNDVEKIKNIESWL